MIYHEGQIVHHGILDSDVQSLCKNVCVTAII